MMQNLFGTDGIRARFGDEPLTPSLLSNLGHAIAQWAQKRYRNNPSILLAHDTRNSCYVVKSALKSGLLLYPVELYDAQVLPSPAVALFLKQEDQFDCGIIISASHNPYHDNGIKIIDALQGKITQDDELEISRYFYEKNCGTDYASLGTERHLQLQDNYTEYVRSFFQTDFLLHNKKVVLDCANGATSQLAPKLFAQLGATVMSLFDAPNGLNINKQCGSTYPQALQRAVVEHKADIGFAFDGDGDRVIAVNRLGHIKNGDDLLALLLFHPRYKSMNKVVGTAMTNRGFELYLTQSGRSLIRTEVGDKHITRELKSENLLLGGENSGHIILGDYLMTGDGIFAALRVMQALSLSDNWDMHTFISFAQVHHTIPIKSKKDLNESPFSEILTSSRVALGQGRLVVRYSGTEPVLRIMVEDIDFEHAQSVCSTLSENLQKRLEA